MRQLRTLARRRAADFLRTTARLALVGALGLALGAAGLGPAAATTVAADLPAPSGLWVNHEECGSEPLVTTLSSDDYNTLPLNFSFAAEVTTARQVLVGPDGDVLDSGDLPVRDGTGRGDLSRVWFGIAEGGPYTVSVQAVGSDGSLGAAAECTFRLVLGPASPDLVTVLGEPAVYTNRASGGVGVPGAFITVPRRSDDVPVAYEYGISSQSGVPPVQLTRVEAGADGLAKIPVVPTDAGTFFLRVVPIDADGVRGGRGTRAFVVGSGPAPTPAHAVTVSEPADSAPDDGLIPLDLRLTDALTGRQEHSSPMGEVSLALDGSEIARTSFDTVAERVMLEESALGTGFRSLRVEYRQFAGATPIVRTARICGGSCSYSGGKASVASTTGEGVRLATDLTAKVSGFSPAPASYTYQWLRDGKTVKGATKKDYLSVPTDQGHRIAVRVTARGPRMVTRSLTSPTVLVGNRDEMHASYGVRSIGTRWEKHLDFREFRDGETAGVVGGGRSVELLAASFYSHAYDTSSSPSDDADMWFDMEAYVQGRGWTGLKHRDYMEYVGTQGEKRRLEAIRIGKGGAISPYYDVFYRVYVPGRGWLGWAANGGTSGTIGYGSRVEAVQIKVLPRGKKPTASGSGNAPYYSRTTQKQVRVEAFMQPNKTWRSAVGGGSTAGRSDSLKAPRRLNAVRVDLDGRYSGGVQVSAKVKGDGWRPYVGNDRTAGSTRLDRPTSAYRMRLTGNMAKHYRVYYRTYVQGVGWLGWAHDGTASGTASYSKRPTAVQVLLVPKGEAAPRSGYGRAAYRR